ncbi:MAG: DUF6356 family protein [Parvularculaceae bacterium]
MLRKIFLEHPRSVGESYSEHFVRACGFATKLISAGAACLAHAFLPCLFKETASNAVRQLHGRMVVDRAWGSSHPRLKNGDFKSEGEGEGESEG